MPNNEILPAAEFQALPLENIIAAPLLGVIKAQAAAAAATQTYINSLIKDGKPLTVDLSLNVAQNGVNKSVEIKAPLLSMVPVPHIRIDSFTTHFKYEISQVSKSTDELSYGANIDADVTKNPFFNLSIKGNVSSKSADESVMNRSGMLEITVHASEAPIPEGLARLLSVLSKALPE
ncbi:MAG TPA: DUF2589 domain-containing protein [Bacteroidales bacterium]|nr:DUF2589 domain-containing protein [Bacteroidales bacterium]